MTIYAISDLHLSSDQSKPMDIFGPAWENHQDKIKTNWDNTVTDDDVVLIAGDHSWAMTFQEAQADLAFIMQRPGKKVLIRGNHDYWWRRESTNRLQKELPDNFTLLQGRAIEINGIWITGTRGWRQEDESIECEEKLYSKVLERELKLFERGLKEIPTDAKHKIAMLHYPPFDTNLNPNSFASILKEYNVNTLVYGHIHSGSYLEGNIDGIEYILASVDHTDFSPVRI